MIKNTIKLTTIFLVLMILQGCPPPVCDPITIEYAPLSDSAKSFVPYINGQTYKLQHSAGHVISFSCERKKEKLNNCFDCEKCISYEQNLTTLKPDYQIDDITIRITSGSEEGQHQINLVFGSSHFSIFPGENDIAKHDSLVIGGVKYRNVYALANYNFNGYYGTQHQLYVDSLYYNNEKGIIRITMSNDEYFHYYEK